MRGADRCGDRARQRGRRKGVWNGWGVVLCDLEDRGHVVGMEGAVGEQAIQPRDEEDVVVGVNAARAKDLQSALLLAG